MVVSSAVALLLLAQTPAAPESPPPLTLAQAIAESLTHSPRLEMARSGVGAARAQIRAARAEMLPNLSTNTGAHVQGPEVAIKIPSLQGLPGGPVGDPSLNHTGPTRLPQRNNTAFEPQLGLGFPVYTGGSLQAQHRAARKGEKAAAARVEAETQKLVLDVAESYLDTLEAQQQLTVASAVRELSEEQLRVTRVRLTAGTVLADDEVLAKADLARSVQREIDAQTRLRQSGAALNSLMGRPAATKLVLTTLPGTEPSATLPASTTAPPSPERLRTLGMERPDLIALREEVRRADDEVNAAVRARRPQVVFQSLVLDRIPKTLLGGFSWALGGSLVQSLFDGGRSRARVELARAERDRRTAALTEAERQADRQVEEAQAALDAAEKRLPAEEAQVTAALRVLETGRLRVHAGTELAVDLKESETAAARAQSGAITARFEAARARVRLAYVVGVAHPESVVELAGGRPGPEAQAPR